jgi:hypothetical protein
MAGAPDTKCGALSAFHFVKNARRDALLNGNFNPRFSTARELCVSGVNTASLALVGRTLSRMIEKFGETQTFVGA